MPKGNDVTTLFAVSLPEPMLLAGDELELVLTSIKWSPEPSCCSLVLPMPKFVMACSVQAMNILVWNAAHFRVKTQREYRYM